VFVFVLFYSAKYFLYAHMLFYVRVGDKRVVLIKGQARFLFVYFLFFKDINYFYPAETWESHKQKDLKSF